MSPEDEIAALRQELARERARADGLQEIIHALTVKRRSSGAERQERYRKRHSDVTSDVIPPSSPPPFPSSFPPSPAPSSPYPLSFPPSSPPPASSKGTAPPSPGGFELTSPAGKKQRKQREPSAAEALFKTIQATREARCAETGTEVVPERWDFARQNKTIGDILREPDEAQKLFEAAWGLYLADDGQKIREPAWSFSYFLTVRARYETRAAREGEA